VAGGGWKGRRGSNEGERGRVDSEGGVGRKGRVGRGDSVIGKTKGDP